MPRRGTSTVLAAQLYLARTAHTATVRTAKAHADTRPARGRDYPPSRRTSTVRTDKAHADTGLAERQLSTKQHTQ